MQICNDNYIYSSEIEREMRWNKFYLKLAQEYANQSKDPKFKVGCVIVTQEGILYPGYNGDEVGGTNQRDSMETGKSNFVHAEANSILKFNPSIHKGSVMFVNYAPCVVCSRMIVNTKAICAVYYKELYSPDTKGIEVLRKCGIKCEQITI